MIQRIVPPLDVVRSDGLPVNTPVLWREHGILDPLSPDVVHQFNQGLSLGLQSESHEHRLDLMLRQERQGHQLSDVCINSIVTGICYLKTKLLHL